MPISPINLVYTKSYTDKGNRYKKSNLGKTAMVASTAAAVITSAAKSGAQQEKSSLKTGGTLVALALMVGSFIDAVTNRLTSTIVDTRFSQVDNTRNQGSALGGELCSHQG